MVNIKPNYTLPLSVKDARNVMMITPNAEFHQAWRATASQDQIRDLDKKGDPYYQNQLQDPQFKCMLPHIGIDVVDGKTEVQFIDGTHRFAALRELGVSPIPVVVESENHRMLPRRTSFVANAPKELIDKLNGESEGQGPTLTLTNKERDLHQTWVDSPEGKEALLREFQHKGFGLVAGQCYEYYRMHLQTPPKHEMKKWLDAKKEEIWRAAGINRHDQAADVCIQYAQDHDGRAPSPEQAQEFKRMLRQRMGLIQIWRSEAYRDGIDEQAREPHSSLIRKDGPTFNQ